MASCAKETFICEVEVLKSEMTACEVVVEGEFASEATMEEWGWSESTYVCLVFLLVLPLP